MPRKSTIERVYEPIIRDLARVQRNIRKEIKTSNRVVNKIVAYIFNTRGKLLRPALALLAGYASVDREDEERSDRLIHLATAIELVHNASLVHDDILDESSFRRELPTLNKMFNSHIALLSGDALFVKAFYILAHNLPREVVEPVTLVTAGMCHGEIINSMQSGDQLDFETYLTVVRLKTAALMSVSTQTGAMTMGADEKIVTAMKDYGMNVGVAYQLVDDYVDDDVADIEGFSLDHAFAAAERARAALAPVRDSIYKEKLLGFLDLVIEMAENRNMSETVNLP